MAKLMGMAICYTGLNASLGDHLVDVEAGHRAAALAGEHKCGLGLLFTVQLAQGAQFIALERVDAINSALQPADVAKLPENLYIVLLIDALYAQLMGED